MHRVLTTRKQFKSCGVNASCIFDREVFKKLWYQCIMCFTTGKHFKSCGVNVSYVWQQGSILKVVLSTHHDFGNKEAVLKFVVSML